MMNGAALGQFARQQEGYRVLQADRVLLGISEGRKVPAADQIASVAEGYIDECGRAMTDGGDDATRFKDAARHVADGGAGRKIPHGTVAPAKKTAE